MTTLDPEPIITDVTDQLEGLIIKSAQFIDCEGGDRISQLQIKFYDKTELNIYPDTSDSALSADISSESGTTELA